ncbi:hypothetical protein J7E70_09660 [Variovorax paradoxus]|nr:hypothetical protein [Variovorax paradoxus]MBT2300729.1 hypothetical protein [Variovorax paradoxus]
MNTEQQLQQLHFEMRERSAKGTAAKQYAEVPLPSLAAVQRKARGPVMGFAVPFLAVMGYYAIGICTFALMAASSVPGGGEVSQLAWCAAESTSPLALAAALAAGRWWV